MFEHEFFPRNELQNVDTKWGRYYRCPSGNYPSVTTVLRYSNWFDKTDLIEWKKRVGKEEAERVSSQALTRGRSIHDLAEKYLMNDPGYADDAMPFNLANFRMLKHSLNRHVGWIYGIEYPLYSKRLKTAGRADLIAEWGDPTEPGGNPVAVIDFKTSKHPKKMEQITHYFVQAAVYAIMFEEMWNFPPIEDIVILILVDHESLQTFHRQKKDFLPIVDALFPMRGFDDNG